MKKTASGEKRPSIGRRIFVISCILLVYLLAVAVAAVVMDARHVRFYMTGPETMELNYGEEYQEPGIYAVTTGQIFGDGEKHLPVQVDSDLDNERLGTYTVTYTVDFMFRQHSIERKVQVVDREAPVIELKHDPQQQADWVTGYQEEGFTAWDNYDGDLTDKVQTREEEGKLIYTVADSSGNQATALRELDYVLEPPEITLLGEAEQTVYASLSYEDPGFAAADSQGRDLSAYVQVSGQVLPYTAGTYELCYTITNYKGETVSATRTVAVLPVQDREPVDPDVPTIYLTFDDGPGPYTGKLLDVLQKYNVKATFFVTGANSKYFDQIGRAYREGHAIGVHTYSHDYRTIYSSEEAFFQDFNAVQELILAQTGSYTQIFRFPGGSSNTVSNFNPGIMSRLTAAMTDLGYQYFDWNVSSGDAGGTSDTDQIVQNVIDGCSGKRAAVVLQHDIKDYSVAAVERIILWGLENGYHFSALDVNSPPAHHGVNN